MPLFLDQQIFQLESLDQVRIPDQRAVADADFGELVIDLADLADTFGQRRLRPEHRRVLCLDFRLLLRSRRIGRRGLQRVGLGRRQAELDLPFRPPV